MAGTMPGAGYCQSYLDPLDELNNDFDEFLGELGQTMARQVAELRRLRSSIRSELNTLTLAQGRESNDTSDHWVTALVRKAIQYFKYALYWLSVKTGRRDPAPEVIKGYAGELLNLAQAIQSTKKNETDRISDFHRNLKNSPASVSSDGLNLRIRTGLRGVERILAEVQLDDLEMAKRIARWVVSKLVEELKQFKAKLAKLMESLNAAINYVEATEGRLNEDPIIDLKNLEELVTMIEKGLMDILGQYEQ